MYILSIDTSLYSLVAVSKEGRIISCETNHVSLNQSESIVRLIEKCLANASIEYKDIDAVCLNIGPGSFTGIRVGMSVANSMLICKKNLIICGIENTDILRYKAERQIKDYDAIVIISEYTKNDCVVGAYIKNDKNSLKKQVELVENKKIFEKLDKIEGLVVCSGSGLIKIYDQLANSRFVCLPRLTQLNPRVMVELAHNKITDFIKDKSASEMNEQISIDFEIFSI